MTVSSSGCHLFKKQRREEDGGSSRTIEQPSSGTFEIPYESVRFCCLCFLFPLCDKVTLQWDSSLVLCIVTSDSVCLAARGKLVLSTSLKGEVEDEIALRYMLFSPDLCLLLL